MITLTIVRQPHGFVGLTVSDRWNIQTLRSEFPPHFGRLLSRLPDSTASKREIAVLRRNLARLGFKLAISRGVNIRSQATDQEYDSLDALSAFKLTASVL